MLVVSYLTYGFYLLWFKMNLKPEIPFFRLSIFWVRWSWKGSWSDSKIAWKGMLRSVIGRHYWSRNSGSHFSCFETSFTNYSTKQTCATFTWYLRTGTFKTFFFYKISFLEIFLKFSCFLFQIFFFFLIFICENFEFKKLVENIFIGHFLLDRPKKQFFFSKILEPGVRCFWGW